MTQRRPGVGGVLVSGGGGFLGRQICAALARLGARVVASPLPRPDLLTAPGRMALLDAGDADTLVHAAWITTTGAFWTSEANCDWLAATLDLVRAFRARGGQRVVLVGSCAEYDWHGPARAAWTERRACRPHTLYGAAKLAAWLTVAPYAQHAGMQAAVARVFTAVGRHEAPARLWPNLLRAAAAGTPLATGPGELTREWLDVRDAGEAVARVALSGLQGPVNIGANRPVSLRELVERVPGAARAVQLGARAMPPGEPLFMAPDGVLLRRATGFAPRFTLDDTIADAIAFAGGDSRAAA